MVAITRTQRSKSWKGIPYQATSIARTQYPICRPAIFHASSISSGRLFYSVKTDHMLLSTACKDIPVPPVHQSRKSCFIHCPLPFPFPFPSLLSESSRRVRVRRVRVRRVQSCPVVCSRVRLITSRSFAPPPN